MRRQLALFENRLPPNSFSAVLSSDSARSASMTDRLVAAQPSAQPYCTCHPPLLLSKESARATPRQTLPLL
jgi:hypothetical protein